MSSRRTNATRARTAGGKKLNPEVLASAEQKALEGLKQRTEEGHLKAGRTPPSQQAPAPGTLEVVRRTVDDAIRDISPVTEDEKLLQQSGPRLDFTRTDPWRVMRIMGEFIEGFDNLATVERVEAVDLGSGGRHQLPGHLGVDQLIGGQLARPSLARQHLLDVLAFKAEVVEALLASRPLG